MPGYKVSFTEPTKPGLICPECGFVLKDAVQTGDGIRLCESCYNDIAGAPALRSKNTGIRLDNKGFYPDKAVRREVLQLLVKCSYHKSGCPWEGKLNNYETHSQDCRYKPVQCPNNGCFEILPKELMDSHVDEHCLFRTITCDYCQMETSPMELEEHLCTCPEFRVACTRCNQVTVRRKELKEHHQSTCSVVECPICGKLLQRNGSPEELGSLANHLNDPAETFRHFSVLQNRLLESQEKMQLQGERLTGDLARAGDLTKIHAEVQTGYKVLADRLIAVEESQLSDSKANTKLSEVLDQTKQHEQSLKILHGQIAQLQQRSSYSSWSSGVKHTETQSIYEGDTENSRIIQLEKKIEELERQTAMVKVHVSEIELQLQASLASTHNGTFLWRIPDVSRRKRDAIDERITSIYSPPFYTGSNGYKMCVRAYLNGDGIGYKTHLSLFFVLMKGEYDPLLKWPFEYKVSLILVDQNHRKHVVQTFKPTPESSSFQRPRSDMNVASGCPQFSKLSVLDDENYVKDDVMYVKCIVDTSRIFHP